MTARELETRVVRAALNGEVLDHGQEGPQTQPLRGALVREILSGAHGALHWRGLRLQGLVIHGNVDLSYCEWRGRLELKGCRISGDVNLDYATVIGAVVLDRSRVRGIEASHCDLTGSFQMRRALVTRGFRGVGMEITGALNLDRSTFVAPSARLNRPAVELYRSRLDDLYMTRTVLVGGLLANGVTVRRNVRLSGTRARARAKLGLGTGPDTSAPAAVSLVGANVGSAIYLFSEALGTDPPVLDGDLNMDRASCSTLRARPQDLRGFRVSVDHFTYDRLVGTRPAEWLRLLERTTIVGTQPYRHLAAVCDSAGEFVQARDARVALQRRIDRESATGGWRSTQRYVLRSTVAYGYRPGWAVAWLILVSVLAAMVLALANDFLVEAPPNDTPRRGFDSPTDAVTFALDSLVPFARLGVTSGWTADPVGLTQSTALVLFVALKGIAWALAALALAATTGLVRKD